MTGSSLGKYSGSAQYKSPEKGAAAGNDTALAGAPGAQGAGGVCQGRGDKLRALPWERSVDVCSHSRPRLPRKQCKSQTSLQLSPLGFCLTVGSSRFLGRKMEHLRSVLSSSSLDALLCRRARAHTSQAQPRMCFPLLEGRLFSSPVLLNMAVLVAAGQAGKADLYIYIIYIYVCVYFVSLCRHWPGPFCHHCVKVTVSVSWLLVGYSPMLSSTLHPPGQPSKNEEVKNRPCRLQKQEILIRDFWSPA